MIAQAVIVHIWVKKNCSELLKGVTRWSAKRKPLCQNMHLSVQPQFRLKCQCNDKHLYFSLHS